MLHLGCYAGVIYRKGAHGSLHAVKGCGLPNLRGSAIAGGSMWFFCTSCIVATVQKNPLAELCTPMKHLAISGVKQDSEHLANSTWKPWLMSHGPTCREGVENKIIHSQLDALAQYPYAVIRKRPLLGLDQPHFECLNLYAFTL